MRLKDKVEIVTGGGRGLGRAYCLRLAEEGAKVVVADIDIENAKKVVKEIEDAGGEGFAHKVDVSSESETQELAKAAIEKYGKIDVLVNNAAYMAEFNYKPISAHTVEEWDRCFAVNVRGTWLCSKAVLPYMQEKKNGKIINVSSGTILGGMPFLLPYVSSKGAVHIMTRCMARELGEFSIKVNCISPGYVPETPGIQAIEGGPPAIDDWIIHMQSIHRLQRPEDLVGTVVFLSSDDSDFITGQFISIDGGLNLH